MTYSMLDYADLCRSTEAPHDPEDDSNLLSHRCSGSSCYGPYDGPEYCKIFVDKIIMIIIIIFAEREGVEQ